MRKISYFLFTSMLILGISLLFGSQKAQADPGTSPLPVVSLLPTTVPTFLPTPLPQTPTPAPSYPPTPTQFVQPTKVPTPIPTVVCKPLPGNTGVVTTTVTVGSTAKYAVWSRILFPNTFEGSYYLQMDNQCGIKVGGISSLTPNVWTWINFSDGFPSNKIVFSLTKGSHLIRMIGNTSNLGLDRIIFTPDMTCVPTGLGDNCNQVTIPTVTNTVTPNPTSVPTQGSSNTPAPSLVATSVSTSPTPIVTLVPPTPTAPIPTDTPVPTATPVPGTQFAISVLLHGIGHGGDNAAPDSRGTSMPIHSQRTIAVEIFDSNNVLIASPTGTVTFDRTDGSYKGIISVGRPLPDGAYLTKIAVPNHLNKSPVRIITITNGQQQPITLAPVSLVAGDLNGDGRLSILDFNILLSCLSDLGGPARRCDQTAKDQADVNDDGAVDLFDLNLYFREISVQSGE